MVNVIPPGILFPSTETHRQETQLFVSIFCARNAISPALGPPTISHVTPTGVYPPGQEAWELFHLELLGESAVPVLVLKVHAFAVATMNVTKQSKAVVKMNCAISIGKKM